MTLIIALFLLVSSMVYGGTTPLPFELWKFNKATPKKAFGLDIHRLMINTANCESDLVPHFNTKYAHGMMQIEESTYEAMRKDVRMDRIISLNQRHYKISISDYKVDTYSNIVCAYTIYIWKFIDVKDKWIPKIAPKLEGNKDIEWVNYKILYNSMDGSTTYKRWSR